MFKFLDNIYGRSGQWKTVRKKHLEKYPKCAACGRESNLEVHHIIPYQIDPSKELDPNNLITLCGNYCHFVFGHLMDWKSWNKNVINDCEIYLNTKNNRPQVEEFGSKQKGNYYETLLSMYRHIIKFYNRIKCWNN